MGSEKNIFEYFTKISTLSRPGYQFNSAIWTNVILNIEDYSINISKNNLQNIHVPNETAEIVNFLFGERTSLVVRASDSGSGDPGSILGRVGVLFP